MDERHGEYGGSSRIDPASGLVTAVCFAEGCDEPAPLVHEIALIPRGSSVARPPLKIPLCRKHFKQLEDTGGIRLFTHPDNLLGL